MKTGFSRICITPPSGTMLFGYYEKRYSKGVLDDLYATAVSFDDGKNKALILTLDVCELSTKQTDKIRQSISNKLGLNIQSIFVNCSHTHTGPSIDKDLDGEPTNSIYDQRFYELVLKVGENAFLDMKESSFSIGKGLAEGISFSRRFKMKDGRVQTNPGVNNDNVLHALGKVNEAVKFLRIDRENSHAIVIVNFGTHADAVGGEYISGDWPNFACSTVEKVFDNVKCVFLTGAQGDVNHINPFPSEGHKKGLNYDTFDGVPRGYEHAKHMGRKVASAVIAGLDKTEPIASDKISFAQKIVSAPSNQENDKLLEAKRIVKLHAEGRDDELPYEKMELTTVVAEATRICALENGPDKFDFIISALKLGEFVLVGLPGECFVEIGERIETCYGKDSIMVCCLTNGGDSYFPTSIAYEEGGYEARTSFLKKGVDDILVKETKKIIKKL